jgi:flagellar biosynthesis protein
MSGPERPAGWPAPGRARDTGSGQTDGGRAAGAAGGTDGRARARRAVALRYDPNDSTAPVVSAAGQGLVADEIIRRAREAGVPITEDPQLAAVLSQIDVGAVIPPELYAVVAEVLAYVYGLDRRAGGRR